VCFFCVLTKPSGFSERGNSDKKNNIIPGDGGPLGFKHSQKSQNTTVDIIIIIIIRLLNECDYGGIMS